MTIPARHVWAAPAPPPAGAPAQTGLSEALAMIRAGMSHLAAADHAGPTAAEQAGALAGMEQCLAAGSLIMERKMLLGIKRRAERPAPATPR